jgi:hypothetical protein
MARLCRDNIIARPHPSRALCCAAIWASNTALRRRNPTQTNGTVERFNVRIEDIQKNHHFRFGEELETTLHRYVLV